MTDERGRLLRLYGPPGTGKTTRLAARTQATVRERGRDSIAIASFSVTAAREIASRPGVKGILPDKAVSTLHSHAFRAIGTPDVALDPKVIKEWNEEASPEWAITGDTRGLSISERGGAARPENAATGDQLIAALDMLRGQGIPRADWPPNVQRFAVRWNDWKASAGAVDFTDMIVQAYHRARDGQPMPGGPEILVVDEAQDLTPIETALALAWAKFTDRTIFALDDDQTINTWRGADPAMVLAADAEDEVLSQSFRLPPAVHTVANTWIQGAHSRVDKPYLPRVAQPDPTRGRHDADDAESYGLAYRVSFGLDSPLLVDALERDIEQGRDPMVLTSCGYMLTPLIAELRRRGVPFHNPHRPSEAAWNPLGSSERTGMATSERVARFLVVAEEMGELARPWTGRDLAAWSDLVNLKAAGIRHGAGTRIKSLAPDMEVPWEVLDALWKADDEGSEGFSRAAAGDLEWLAAVVKKAKADVTSYPIQVARSRGPSALTTGTRAAVGTIHSAKGATASRVYLSPDLSPSGSRQWHGDDPAGVDQVRRLMYVGLSRSFHDLIVLAPSNRTFIEPADLLPAELEVRP